MLNTSQDKPACLACPSPEYHLPCRRDSGPRRLQTAAMTHIAHCIRVDAGRSHVYITQPKSSKQVTFKEPGGHTNAPAKSAAVVSPPLRSSPARYQLWPSPALNNPGPPIIPNASAERLNALSLGRSQTSLSDTAVSEDSAPFWQRAGSLTRRRKVSVPELGQTMTTVQEFAVDSPTIPGRPPLRKIASDTGFHHERASSLPGATWRTGPFGDAMMACVTGPSTEAPKLEATGPLGRRLSPILSPGIDIKPKLKVDTTDCDRMDIDEIPPEVPPKPPFADRKCSPAPPPLKPKSSRTQLATPSSAQSGGTTPLSALDLRRSPFGSAPLPTPVSALSASFTFGSPSTALDSRSSPRSEKRDPLASCPTPKKELQAAHGRNMSESSVLDRGRPVRRSSKRQKTRACSENDNEQAVVDNWKLPSGLRLPEASESLSKADRTLLHKQARDQADKFEVLSKRDVTSMSRELRALDERCDYLRKTYKSLRAGRQKLHGRMISYLKRSETVIFSRESLLKQEEALIELDISIDEFITKLEQAENRRLRLRQKLLEHVAAAVLLDTPSLSARAETEAHTPPRSPVKAESPSRPERRDVESIKIYADGHVLSLFADIEQAIGQMCEQAC